VKISLLQPNRRVGGPARLPGSAACPLSRCASLRPPRRPPCVVASRRQAPASLPARGARSEWSDANGEVVLRAYRLAPLATTPRRRSASRRGWATRSSGPTRGHGGAEAGTQGRVGACVAHPPSRNSFTAAKAAVTERDAKLPGCPGCGASWRLGGRGGAVSVCPPCPAPASGPASPSAATPTTPASARRAAASTGPTTGELRPLLRDRQHLRRIGERLRVQPPPH
jgi:hypothetical protein